MFSSLRSLFAPPVFDDEEKTRIAKFLHISILTIIAISVLVGATDALAGIWITGSMLALVIFPLILVYWLTRSGKVTPASYVLMISLVIIVTGLLAIGQGIHDIGLINYALLMIITSYLLQRKGLVIVTGLIIVAVGIVVFGEMYHVLPVKVNPTDFLPRPADFVIVSLTVLIGAVAIGVLSDTLMGALQKARESENRWRSLVDNTPDVILLISPQGEITFANLFTIERSAGEIAGRNIFELIPQDAQFQAHQAIEKVLNGAPTQLEMPIHYRFNDDLRWFSLRLSPIRHSDGQVSAVMVMATSVQHLKDYEEELRASRETLRVKTEQLAILYEIGKTVTSLQDLNGALQIILEQMKSILPLDAFIVSLYQEKTKEISFPLLYEDGRLWQEASQPLSLEGGTALVIRTRKPYLTNSASQDSQEIVHWVDVGSKPTESIMIAPMLVGSRVIGAISVQSYMPNMYNPEMLALLSGAASQIAVAVENAQLFEAAQKRAEQLTALNEIGRSISRLKNLEDALEDAYHQLCSLFSLDVFFIALYNADSQEITFPLLIDGQQRWIESPRVMRPGMWVEKTIRENRPQLVNKTQADINKPDGPGTVRLGDTSRAAASFMMSPLVAGDKVIGVVSAQSYTLDSYGEDDLAMLTSVSYQIATAIENARLYEQLQTELVERKRVEAEIRVLNTGLEERVRARTAELEATSKELEGFTYTVSHDLRAPLRGINSFSHILLEDYGKNLPQPAHEHLIRIQDSARYMGRLIDDLLNFTRIGRHPIRKGQIMMMGFVQQAFNEVTRDEDLTRIEFTIGTLPVVQADPVLLKQVINNLLSNAIKFSARREVAKIKVGCQKVDGKDVFYVQDNGAGFDMTYVSKLFGVFQRLHHQSEFEGTGVGLAITQRILQRHGGRIWAESVVDVGATFYFTLEP